MEADFQRRKKRAITAFKTIEKFITDKKSTTKNKIRRIYCFISSIFLYYSKLWAPTKRIIEKINCIHRSFQRKIINKKWNYKILDKNLYMMTNTVPWSKVTRERRIKFFHHILRQKNYSGQASVTRNDETNQAKNRKTETNMMGPSKERTRVLWYRYGNQMAD